MGFGASLLQGGWRNPRLWWRALFAAGPILAITFYLYLEGRTSERLLLETETARQADNVALQFHQFIESHMAALKSVGNFALNAPADDGGNDGYAQFIKRLIADTPGFEAVGWIDPNGKLERLLPNEAARFALDPAGAINGVAVRKAIEARQPASANSFNLRPGETALALTMPFYRDGRLAGLAAGVVRLDDAWHGFYGSDLQDFWNLEIFDHTGQIVYRPAVNAAGLPERLLTVRHVAVADRSWKMRMWPTPMLGLALHTASPQRILAIGLVAALIAAAANCLLIQRQERLSASLQESTRLAADVEAAQSHLTELVNGIDAVIWESSLAMKRFTFVNDYGRKLLGLDEAQWIAEPNFWYEHAHPDDRERALENARQAAEPDHAYPVEYRMIGADGRLLWVREIITVIGVKNRPVGKRGVIVDVTARIQAEEALRQSQKLESLGVLAGGIAHDFNNLLTTILGNAEMLDRQLGPGNSSGARTYLDKIERTTRRLAELTRQMLAYSGKGKFSVAELDFNDIIAEMMDLLAVSIPKNVHVSYYLDQALPRVEADAAQIRQVILNLLTNAAEAIGEQVPGVVVIRTSFQFLEEAGIEQDFAGQELEPGRYVRLEVSDTGCGMTAETLSKIFDPFFTTKFTGRGLGLAALRGIVRGHRGGIRIFSQPGEGTVFTLVFPAATGVSEPATPVERLAPAVIPGLRTHVLIVDDEHSLRTLMADALGTSGFDVLQAADGLEGVEQFQRHADDIDVVVLDLTMPRLNGAEAYKQIIAIRPDACVILCSGYTKEEVHQQFTGHELAGFMEKPFTPSELIAKIRAVLGEQRLDKQAAADKSASHEWQFVMWDENNGVQRQPADDSTV